MLLGIPDFWIWLVYILCIFSSALCVVYGLLNWNKGKDAENGSSAENQDWAKKEKEIEDKL